MSKHILLRGFGRQGNNQHEHRSLVTRATHLRTNSAMTPALINKLLVFFLSKTLYPSLHSNIYEMTNAALREKAMLGGLKKV